MDPLILRINNYPFLLLGAIHKSRLVIKGFLFNKHKVMIRKLFVSEYNEDLCLEVFENENGHCTLKIEDAGSNEEYNFQSVILDAETLEILVNDLTQILEDIT